MTTDPPPDVPPEPPASQAEPDPVEELLAALDQPEPGALLADLSDEGLALLAAEAVGRARGALDRPSLDRLQALRRVTLARNARRPHALVLAGVADVAAAVGDSSAELDALDHLVGVRTLLAEPVKAHAAQLALARAQARAGQPARAEATLVAAMERAKAIERTVERKAATECLARTLLELGRLLLVEDRRAEAAEWLAGAVGLAEDPALRASAESALLAAQAR